jgi:hypothetical protein
MQKFLSHFSKLTRLNLFIALFLLSFFSIYRLIFFWTFSNNTQHNDILYAFYLGLKFDWRLAILMVLPILLTGWLSFLHPLKNAIASLFWLIGINFVQSNGTACVQSICAFLECGACLCRAQLD